MKDIIKFIKPHTTNNQVKVTIDSVNPDTGDVTMKLGPAFVSLSLVSILEKGETGYVLPEDIHPGDKVHLLIEKGTLKLLSEKAYKELTKQTTRKATTSGSTSTGGLERF